MRAWAVLDLHAPALTMSNGRETLSSPAPYSRTAQHERCPSGHVVTGETVKGVLFDVSIEPAFLYTNRGDDES